MAVYVEASRAYLMAWLYPGGGHFAMGDRRRGWFFAAMLWGTFLVGEVLARGGAVTPSEHPWYFGLGQLWSAAMLGVGLVTDWIVGGGGSRWDTYEIGQLYATCAFLMTICSWVDLYRLRKRLGARRMT